MNIITKRKSNLIQKILWALIIIPIFIALIIIFTEGIKDIFSNLIFWGTITIIPISICCLYFAKNGKYKISTRILVLIISLITLYIGIFQEDTLLPYLVIPIIIANIFFSFEESLYWILGIGIATGLGSFINEEYNFVGFLYGIGSFLFLFSTLILIYKKHTNKLEEYRLSDIKKNREKLLTILNNLRDGIILINEKGNIEFINPIAGEILEIAYKESIGKNYKEIYKTNTIKSFDRIIKNLRTQKQSSSTQISNLKTRSQNLLLEETIILANNDNDELIITFRNITKQKQKEKELNKKIEESEVFLKAALGREEKIKELKTTIKKLEQNIEEK